MSLVSALQLVYRCANGTGLLKLRPVEWAYLRSYFAYKRLIEDPYAGLAQRRPELFRGGHIFDVGANVGYTTLLFARALSPGFRVFAFEPEAENFRRLQRVVAGSPWADRIAPHRLALGNAEAGASLAINPAHPGDHRMATDGLAGARQEVRMMRLDRFIAEQTIQGTVRFVKIDVQGYELEVSRGMEGLIAETPDLVVGLEVAPDALHSFGASAHELIRFYTERSFRPFAIEADGLRPVEGPDLGAVPKRGYVDLILTRRAS